MRKASDELDRYFPEMRWRCLSLAADLDRVQRSTNGAALLSSDPRLVQLRKARSGPDVGSGAIVWENMYEVKYK